MAATSFDPRNPQIISRYGIAPINSEGVEAASQSFKAGALVALDASGGVSIAATGASTSFFGIVQKDAVLASTVMPVQEVSAEDEVRMLITDASASVGAHTNCVPGVAYDILVTSGLFSINHADTTNPAMIFVRGINDAAGTATNYGRFRIVSSVATSGLSLVNLQQE
jgi:hypothetical protein